MLVTYKYITPGFCQLGREITPWERKGLKIKRDGKTVIYIFFRATLWVSIILENRAGMKIFQKGTFIKVCIERNTRISSVRITQKTCRQCIFIEKQIPPSHIVALCQQLLRASDLAECFSYIFHNVENFPSLFSARFNIYYTDIAAILLNSLTPTM